MCGSFALDFHSRVSRQEEGTGSVISGAPLPRAEHLPASPAPSRCHPASPTFPAPEKMRSFQTPRLPRCTMCPRWGSDGLVFD